MNSLKRAFEQSTGESIDKVRGMTLEEIRDLAEQKHGKPCQFPSRYPFVGRGNVLRDRIVSGSQVNAALDAALARS